MEGQDVILIGVITGLNQVFKGLGLKPKYCPLVAVVLGVVAGCFYVSPDNVLIGILEGLKLGLASVGLFSGTKNTIQAVKDKNI